VAVAAIALGIDALAAGGETRLAVAGPASTRGTGAERRGGEPRPAPAPARPPAARPAAAAAASKPTTASAPAAAAASPRTAAGAEARGAAATGAGAGGDVFVGDAQLRGHIDLDRAVVKRGRYEVRLPAGRRAALTLEPAIQRTAEQVLERARAPYAAVVVMALDGRILALAGRSNADKRERDFALPLKVWAPAASVFKVITAAALLDAGLAADAIECFHGGLRSVDPSHLTDDARRDTECHDLTFAVARSQNALLAKLAHKHLRPELLRAMAIAFGFAAMPAFALDAEACRAEIPDAPLEFARVAAGFWNTELSPLGGALVANTIASGGHAVTPRIVAAVIDADRTERPVVGVAPKRVLSEAVAKRVADMMVATCEAGGTAYPAFHDRRGRRYLGEVTVAGKTGSLTRDQPSYLAYSWFVGFAPADTPEVVISVLLANPPKWHLKAHTAARIVLESAFPRP
jgi:cell division protein FtsI/penicillin-binding protein 2